MKIIQYRYRINTNNTKSKKSKKAQISIEFIAVIGILFLILMAAVFFSTQLQREAFKTNITFDKTKECLKIARAMSEVYSNGHNAEVRMKTNYLLTIFNDTFISIEDKENNTFVTNRIAYLASNCGPTDVNDFEPINQTLAPDWYYICLGGCYSCDWFATKNITKNLTQLIANINNYDTIYLEDAHMNYNSNSRGILENWTKGGKALIVSEHAVCRYGSGSYPPNYVSCNIPAGAGDVWDIFGIRLHEQGGSYGNNLTVIRQEPVYNLSLGEKLDFEENSYIEAIGNQTSKNESESMTLSSFSSTTSCSCNSPTTSGGKCIRNTGSTSTWANATWKVNVTGTYNVKVRYCGEHDGNDQWKFYVNDSLRASWNTINMEPNWQDRTIQTYLQNGDVIKISCKRGTSQSYCNSDFISINTLPTLNTVTIATYDANLQPGIAYWDYGTGRVFYFGDFQVNMWGGKDFTSNVLIGLIQKAYYTIGGKGKSALCTFYGKSVYGQVTGDFRIRNDNGITVIENSSMY